MEKYVKPSMEVEQFLADIITASPGIGCGSGDDETPDYGFGTKEESSWG